MYTHSKKFLTGGNAVELAESALIMIHGRGGTAENIIGLAIDLNVKTMAIYAPQATNNSWYPYSFMAPEAENQPALDSALNVLGQLVETIVSDGISVENIYFLGFSQGACLLLEYLCRNALKYGGAVAFTGGLIGEMLDTENYSGNFNLTPILITTGDPDPHVPLIRVRQSVEIVKNLNGNAILEVFANRPHTISQKEIELANQLVFTK